ncbi:MAG: FtsW/RodA/SpoVE family cell cycle protein [Muribaculaceae bacterium]|nr:FtsW/RodA/SpoVE family cell cycle protein [Muribaculaceae bacterium]
MAFRANNPSEPRGGGATVTPPEAAVVNPTDTHIWGVYYWLVAISVIELYSASSFEISKQGLYGPLARHVLFLFIGYWIIRIISRIHYTKFIKVGHLVTIVSVLAMIYVMFFGEVVNGAKRAIALPFFSLQPAEFIKISAVLTLAYVLGTTQLKKDEAVRNRGLKWAAGLVLMFSALLFSQGLTNTLILMALCVSMLLLGSLEMQKFWMIMGVFLVFAVVALGVKMFLASDEPAEKEVFELVDPRGNKFHVPEAAGSTSANATSRLRDNTWKNRIKAFADTTPRYERPLTAKNLQEMRSYMAQANGGWTGVWPGNSRETSRLPLAFSDFIFAIIVEDIGFLGGMFIMILYLWLLARAYFIAYKCNQMYPAFLVTGCALLIALQALCHMAIVSGAGPVSGQPLPLFSKGGTSILVTSMAFGIMLSVSRFAARGNEATRAELESDRNSLPESLQAQNPSQA